MSSRLEKVNDLLAENISEIIEHDLRDPRKGLITVTGVRVSPDLRHAQVFVTTLGEEREKREMVQILEHASGFIRSELGRRVRLKFIPEIQWSVDNSVEYAQRIDEVLRRLREERGDSEGEAAFEPGGESPSEGPAGSGEPDGEPGGFAPGAGPKGPKDR